ncbi:MAG: hypothetical protein ABI868_22980 [Acidobacteriota bacterium]
MDGTSDLHLPPVLHDAMAATVIEIRTAPGAATLNDGSVGARRLRVRHQRAALLMLATAAVAAGSGVSAHRLDEFLQAARLAVGRDRVQLEMSLTPGAAIADAVIRGIDADRNGILTEDEERAYASRVLSALILRVDDSLPLRLQLASARFPDVSALRTGDGAILIRSEADVSRFPAGPHRVLFDNRNAAGGSVYLANALVPEDDEVVITGQQRAADQSQLTIDFVVGRTPGSGLQWAWIGAAGAVMLALWLARRV